MENEIQDNRCPDCFNAVCSAEPSEAMRLILAGAWTYAGEGRNEHWLVKGKRMCAIAAPAQERKDP